jgi:uncharacterized membrane-anchored protein
MTRDWPGDAGRPFRRFLSKAPELTIFFWIIKVLVTTVGDTFADFLSDTVALGLTLTTVAMTVALLVALIFQFRAQRYIPGLYWLVVALISIVGTLLTDNILDNIGVPLEATAVAFAVALAVTFVVWYRAERSLSVHTIDTNRREGFYWLAILLTFALGTAADDLTAERLGWGYATAAVFFAVLIAVVAVARLRFGLNAVLAFWIAYVLTRPFGASLGGLLSQPRDDGGAGLGTAAISIAFLFTIVAVVTYLSVSRRDAPQLNAKRYHEVVGR